MKRESKQVAHDSEVVLLGLIEVRHATNLSRTSIYKYISQGKFPQPVPVVGRRVAWRSSDIEQWIERRGTWVKHTNPQQAKATRSANS